MKKLILLSIFASVLSAVVGGVVFAKPKMPTCIHSEDGFCTGEPAEGQESNQDQSEDQDPHLDRDEPNQCIYDRETGELFCE